MNEISKAMMHKVLVLLAAIAVGLTTAAAAAQTSVIGPITFSGYNLGPLVNPNGAGAPVAGQQGWSGGSCGLPSTGADEAVVNNAAFPSAGLPPGLSLRFSSAYESGCFDDLFTPVLQVKGGAPGALVWVSGGPMVPCTTTSCQPYFETSWTVASATGGYQPGLTVDFSPSAGPTGARTAQVRMKHTTDNTGKQILQILASDVEGYCRTGTPAGTVGNCGTSFFNSAPCYQCANFTAYYTVGNYDPTKQHKIKLTMQMGPGPDNDIVQIYVDDALAFSGLSWSGYYWYDTESARGNPGLQAGRASDTVLIRAGSAPAIGTLNYGYLLSNITLCSAPNAAACGTTLTANFQSARRGLSSGAVRVQHRQPR